MSRFLFFLLLLATLGLGVHLWLSAAAERTDFSTRERNRDEMRIVAVTPPTVAARTAEETRKTVQSLAGAACVEFSGIAAADFPKAREAFAAMKMGDRVVERRIEEITRHWVFVPPASDRRQFSSRPLRQGLPRRQGRPSSDNRCRFPSLRAARPTILDKAPRSTSEARSSGWLSAAR